MIDPSMTDILLESPDAMSLPMALDKIKARDEKIANLEASLGQKTTNWEFASAQLQKRVAQIESFEGALKNNEWDFDFETLSDLAGYFDIELNREYDVTITVRWSGTVTAPMNFDMDDIENFLDIRIDTDYRTSDAIIDLYQDEFDIDYDEAL